MCHPEGVFVEALVGEYVTAEAIAAIDDGLHAIVVLHHLEPLKRHTLYLLLVLARGQPFALVLDVEHRRQVALFKVCLTKEELSLLLGRYVWSKKMVSTSYQAVSACLVEVFIKVVIHQGNTLRSLDDNEGNGVVAHVSVTEPFPVDFLLIVTHVYASYGVFRRICCLAINGLPLETVGVYKEME